MSGDITPYLARVTSEYANATKFNAELSAILQPFADGIDAMNSLPGLFDLDVAVGDQLDKTGQWIGATRQLSIPLTNVFFSFDTANLGFDQGEWQGPFNPTGELITLADDTYRLLLQVTAAANQWDGTIPGIYDSWVPFFTVEGGFVHIVDGEDGTMAFNFNLVSISAVVKALLNEGLLLLRPMCISASVHFF